MRYNNILLILLLFIYALSCGNSAEKNKEKARTVKKSDKQTAGFSQKINSKKNQNSASQKIKAPDFNLADLDVIFWIFLPMKGK